MKKFVGFLIIFAAIITFVSCPVQYDKSTKVNYVKGTDDSFYTVTGPADSTSPYIVIDSYYQGEDDIDGGYPVQKIANEAFQNNTSLKKVSLGANLETIGERAFLNCSSIETITNLHPIGLKEIGTNAFSGCSSLSVDLLELTSSLDTVGNGAFSGCEKIKKVIIQNGLGDGTGSVFGTSLFNECTGLTSIEFLAEAIKTVPDSFAKACSSLTSVTLHGSIIEINQNAFTGCTSLTSITFNGTKAEWAAITKNGTWCDSTLTTIKCTDGDTTP